MSTEVQNTTPSQHDAKLPVTRRAYYNCSKCDGKETVEVIEKLTKKHTSLEVKKCSKCKHQWGLKQVLTHGG